MAKRVCFNCGKDLGEKEPYDSNLTLIDTCKKCRVALEKKWEVKKIAKFMMNGGATL